VIIANHGLDHKSMVKIPFGVAEKDWVNQRLSDLETSEIILTSKLNTSYKYFALPYGEYSANVQTQLSEMGYVVFTQQSGAVGLQTELTSIPRFPASMPYDNLDTLEAKLYSLPFQISKETQLSETVVRKGEVAVTNVKLDVVDFEPKAVQCFISNLGKAKVTWVTEREFDIELPVQLQPGRTRSNCTAPSLRQPGRYYWFSKSWFVPYDDGTWHTW
jgi:peptidoglycan/xylan/chitin deacetylase (PgdA/CDA1 family)